MKEKKDIIQLQEYIRKLELENEEYKLKNSLLEKILDKVDERCLSSKLSDLAINLFH